MGQRRNWPSGAPKQLARRVAVCLLFLGPGFSLGPGHSLGPGFSLGLAASATAQQMPAEAAIGSADAKIQHELYLAQKKATVSRALQLTDEEAALFWSIYGDYVQAEEALNARLGTVINEFASNYDYMTEAKAREIRERSFAIDRDRLTLLTTTAERAASVLPEYKVTRLVQVLNRINLTERVQLAERLPLVK